MKYKIGLFIFLVVLCMLTHTQTAAAEQAAASSAALSASTLHMGVDMRAKTLEDYLKQKNSPLAEYARVFVNEADRYNLDWKLVAAISGVESGFGAQIPGNSYNGWGWGVYGGNVHEFVSWNDGIHTVSEGLSENYIKKLGTSDIYSIGRMYAADPGWAYKVSHYLKEIDAFEQFQANTSLPISL